MVRGFFDCFVVGGGIVVVLVLVFLFLYLHAECALVSIK